MIVPFKCEICGTEGKVEQFMVCPVCNRMVGRECWDGVASRAFQDDEPGRSCMHRSHPPDVSKKGYRIVSDDRELNDD